MLDYEAEDFQETFMATFRVSFSDMFGNLQTFDLREGGDKIPVTLANRQVHSFITGRDYNIGSPQGYTKLAKC